MFSEVRARLQYAAAGDADERYHIELGMRGGGRGIQQLVQESYAADVLQPAAFRRSPKVSIYRLDVARHIQHGLKITWCGRR